MKSLDLRTSALLVVTGAATAFVSWLAISYASLVAEVVAVILGAFLLSLAVRPAADRLARYRIPRGITVVVIYILLAGLFVLIGWLTIPPLGEEIAVIQGSAPALFEAAVNRLAAIPLLQQIVPSADSVAQSIGQQVQGIAGTVVNTAASVGKFMLDIVLVLILAAYFTADRKIGQGLVERWFPTQHQGVARSVLMSVSSRLSRWIGAQLVIAIYFAVAYGGGLLLIGLPFGLTIGVMGGILEIVPFLGGTFALVAAILSALIADPGKLIWILLLHVVVTQVEANFVQPTLIGRAVNVHPAAILVALLVGVTAGGVIGALFAVPAVVILTAILDEVQPVERAVEPEDQEAVPDEAEGHAS